MTRIPFLFTILLVQNFFLYAQTANETVTKTKSESKPKIKMEPVSKNISAEMQRITQPIAERSSNTQIGSRTLVVPNTGNVVQLNNLTDFRPSPQLDNFFEFNRLPVAPAQAESKHFPGVTLNEPLRPKHTNWLQNKQEKPIRSEEIHHHWLEAPQQNLPPKTWFNKVNFPTQNPIFRGRDQILAYSDETTTIQYPYVVTGTNQDTSTKKTSPDGYDTNARFPEPHVYEYGTPYDSKKGSILHKTHFEHPYGLSAPGELHNFPWKKIVKFLTALIPIGLLLSALTPTVINVTASNTTLSRGRAHDDISNTEQKLVSSLNYLNRLDSAGCEEKVICELLLGAGSSQNAEHHIKNLLNAFTEHEGDAVQQVETLNKILRAVQKEDCSSLSCELGVRSVRDLRSKILK